MSFCISHANALIISWKSSTLQRKTVAAVILHSAKQENSFSMMTRRFAQYDQQQQKREPAPFQETNLFFSSFSLKFVKGQTTLQSHTAEAVFNTNPLECKQTAKINNPSGASVHWHMTNCQKLAGGDDWGKQNPQCENWLSLLFLFQGLSSFHNHLIQFVHAFM